ncbi:DUF3095 domain-containing protein [Flavobacterium zepuense]|uniref:DUF3095 domain-containing protein n=1 Tax=Flavobacterium zepuense TaxID=2593302 RepID=A0A552UZE0_9FLAO|nr:DUF3095 domain-containing protein [Flavobacterium zepuense]TRW23552.1 DUF3095 domain-containing protein [Flavobacterium zepuense]
MDDQNSEQFYTNLPLSKVPLGEMLGRINLFANVPPDWHVVITDIIGSTQQVMGGRHQDVNLIATGSIVTVLNIAFGMQVTVPFFFGGDGATFIVPATLIDKVMDALSLYRINTQTNFNLQLRTGTVPVKQIYNEGHEIHIAKFKRSPAFSIPVVLGNGLNYAEKIIKGDDYLFSATPPKEDKLDLSGMQCRWDMIAPPENKEEIVTLLVVAQKGIQQSVAFKKVLEKMDELYGSPEKRQPISVAKLKLKTTFNRLGTEMRAKIGQVKWMQLLRNWLTSFYGYIYFSTKKGKTYLESLVEMSDTLVIDGKINTVISGSAKQRAALQQLLDEMETAGEILYGLHISGASIMSCYVRNLEDDHIHFVDGAEGGYTQAAKVLKAKLAK